MQQFYYKSRQYSVMGDSEQIKILKQSNWYLPLKKKQKTKKKIILRPTACTPIEDWFENTFGNKLESVLHSVVCCMSEKQVSASL